MDPTSTRTCNERNKELQLKLLEHGIHATCTQIEEIEIYARHGGFDIWYHPATPFEDILAAVKKKAKFSPCQDDCDCDYHFQFK